jgi:hypothetical protein
MTLCGALLTGTLTTAAVASADPKQDCATAYERTQQLRDEGNLSEAKKNALACTAPVCAAFIVEECTGWLAQIDASMPTMLLEVRGPSGTKTTSAHVELDGKLWLDELDGRAKALNPGSHTIRVLVPGAEPSERWIQIDEGEKNRKVTVALEKSKAPAAPPEGRLDAAPSSGPWIIGGIGLASLVAGGVLGGLVMSDYAVVSDPAQCNATRRTCTPEGADASSRGRLLGPVTTVALAVGGVGVATAAIWLGVRSSSKGAKPASVQASAGVFGGTIGIRVGGSF